jgi:hypothetical protein
MPVYYYGYTIDTMATTVPVDIPQESWNGRIKEVVPRIFGDLKYLGRLTKQGPFRIFQDGPKK